MKAILNKTFICLTLLSTIVFTNCDNSNEELPLELSIQNKVELIENGQWLLKGFETNVMYAFVAGERLTYYGKDGDFPEAAIPGTQAYTITGELLTLDFNFGNFGLYELRFSCDNNIVEFYLDGEIHSTLYKRESNYKDCL